LSAIAAGKVLGGKGFIRDAIQQVGCAVEQVPGRRNGDDVDRVATGGFAGQQWQAQERWMGIHSLAHPVERCLQAVKITGSLMIKVSDVAGDGRDEGIKNPIGHHSRLGASRVARGHRPDPWVVGSVRTVPQELLEQQLGRKGQLRAQAMEDCSVCVVQHQVPGS
jgi:hypothetical protein